MFYVTISQLSLSLLSNMTACLVGILQALWIQVGYFDKSEHLIFRYLLITPFLSWKRRHKLNLSGVPKPWAGTCKYFYGTTAPGGPRSLHFMITLRHTTR